MAPKSNCALLGLNNHPQIPEHAWQDASCQLLIASSVAKADSWFWCSGLCHLRHGLQKSLVLLFFYGDGWLRDFRTCPSLAAVALQWRAAEHVSASVRSEGFFLLAYQLIFVHTYMYVWVVQRSYISTSMRKEETFGEPATVVRLAWGWLTNRPAEFHPDTGQTWCRKACPLEATLSSNRIFVSGEVLIFIIFWV